MLTLALIAIQEKVSAIDLKIQTIQKSERPKRFSVDDIKHDEKKMLMYTSIPYDIFEILVEVIERFKINYWMDWKVTSIPLKDQVFMFLVKLKLNLRDLDLAHRFLCSDNTVTNVFRTFLFVFHEILVVGILDVAIPSQMKCKGSMPKSFDDFLSARVAMDATEITMDIPSHLDKQSRVYSHYKSRHTVKSVTCVAPNAALVYASPLYPGSTSDTAIVEHTGLAHKFVPGDLILADKGFTIQLILPQGVNLNIPPFLVGKGEFTKKEAQLTFKIGRSRIHVERSNERIKNFAILVHISSHYRDIATEIFQVCAALTNVQAPLLREIA